MFVFLEGGSGCIVQDLQRVMCLVRASLFILLWYAGLRTPPLPLGLTTSLKT